MAGIDLSTRREVCWDEALMEENSGVTIRMHKPEFRGTAFRCDKPWEGKTCGYFGLVKEGNLLRLYYRGGDVRQDGNGNLLPGPESAYCYAESTDGITFHRVPVNLFDHQGSGTSDENNIILMGNPDDFCVCLDSNPDCLPEERFKAVSGVITEEHQGLDLYISPDGVHFTRQREIVNDGTYDSHNVLFWDALRGQYWVYYRGIHRQDGTCDGKWIVPDDFIGKSKYPHQRDVRVRYSKDLVNWSEPRRIAFAPEQEDYQLYTNQVQPYYRAPHMFLGMPSRFLARTEDRHNVPYLPDFQNRMRMTEDSSRLDNVMTDCILITSRDGVNFRRTDEAFLTPGPQALDNWYYGNCYPTLGMVETPSPRPGHPKELSIYVHEHSWVSPIELQRYALRIDGFFSWHGDYNPGTVLTKPVTFAGHKLDVNFATSALGHVRFVICDEDGTPIPGYDSGRLYGDDISRPVGFAKPLAELIGKTVRLRIELKDAELYSFRFEGKKPPIDRPF